MLMAMNKWLGFFGVILAFVIGLPGAVIDLPFIIFLIVFWIVEGVFPGFYCIVWGIETVGLIIALISSIGE